jgi:hypothetical protein
MHCKVAGIVANHAGKIGKDGKKTRRQIQKTKFDVS